MPNLQAFALGAVLAVIAALGLTIFIQHEKLNAAQSHMEQTQSENSVLRAENSRWKVTADQQNKKIAIFAARQAAKQKALASAEKTTDAATAPLIAKAHAIETQPLARGDDCDAARIFENLYLEQQSIK